MTTYILETDHHFYRALSQSLTKWKQIIFLSRAEPIAHKNKKRNTAGPSITIHHHPRRNGSK
jgi:hypothetical protein